MSSNVIPSGWMGKKGLYCLVFAAIVLGGFLRFYALSSQSYWMDESFTINAVMSITEHGSTVLDSGRIYSCPTYCYPAAFAVHFFGANAFAYRLVAAVAGTAFIVVAFFVGSALFDPLIGVVVALFTAFSYWQIAWSRQARWYTLFELFFWLALIFFYLAMRRERHRWLYALLAFLCTGAAIATHALGILLPIVFLSWFLVEPSYLKKISASRATGAVAFVAAAVALLWLAHINVWNIALNFITGIHPAYELPYYLNFYLRTYWLFALFALVALWDTAHPKRTEIRWLALAFLLYLVPLSFLTQLVEYRYLFALTPVLLILGAVGMQYVMRLLPKPWYKIAFSVVVALFFLTVAGGVVWPQSTYFLESDNPATLGSRPYYAYTPQPDWNGAYAYIEANQTNGDIVISSVPTFNKIFLNESGYWLENDYLGVGDPNSYVQNGHEYYVNAQVIGDLADLQTLTSQNRGFIVFDYMATDGRVSPDILAYIKANFKEVFYEYTNAYSQIWVYQF